MLGAKNQTFDPGIGNNTYHDIMTINIEGVYGEFNCFDKYSQARQAIFDKLNEFVLPKNLSNIRGLKNHKF